MHRYTIRLREIVEQTNIFNFEYPVFSQDFKKEIETAFINKFMFREIGVETPSMFLHFLKQTFNEIMPYYNKLYATTLYEYNALLNYDVTENVSNVGSGSTEQSTISNNTDKSLNKNSDTPNGETDLNNPKIVSDMSKNESESENNSSSSSSNKGSSEMVRTMQGNIGTMTTQDLIQKERDIIINVVQQILRDREVVQLFMGVY